MKNRLRFSKTLEIRMSRIAMNFIERQRAGQKEDLEPESH